MLALIRERDFFHPFVIWLILLSWYFLFSERLFSIPQANLDSFVAEHSFWLFYQVPKEAEEVTIIAIDETSRYRLNTVWPWKRSVTAKLIRHIARFEPAVIGLDIVFSGRSEEEEDKDLISALDSHPNIALAYALRGDDHKEPAKDLIHRTPSIGFVNKPGRGSLVEKTRTFYSHDGKDPLFSFEVEIFLSYLGIDKRRIKVDDRGIVLEDRLLIPSPDGVAHLNYLVHPSGFRTIPASSILEEKVGPEDIRGKIVLVGITDPLVHDEHLTPLGLWPGVTIIGNSLVMLLSKGFLRTASPSQNLLVAFALGVLVLFINRRFRVLRNSILTLGIFIPGYFFVLYLRSRHIHFAYLLILFSGASAYLVPNLYRYLNLLYLSARLKNLAVKDPLTGFYSARYFLLELNEKLRSREIFSFAALRIVNYSRLSLKLDFEQTKHLAELLAGRLKSEAGKSFSRFTLSRLSGDTLAIAIEDPSREKVESFVAQLVHKAAGLDWDLDEKGMEFSLQACLIHKSRALAATSDDLLCQMESAFAGVKEGRIIVEDLGKGLGDKNKTRSKDMLDFIAYDWEERSKDLENSLKALLEANKKLDHMNWGTLNALARAIDAKSEWTAGHSERVTELSLAIGRVLGLSREELDNIHRAALLHDVGKIGLPPALLDKPSALSEEEYSLIREHPGIGERILEPIEAYAEIIPMVKQHHEWFNGKGYPDGLSGEAICLGARILAVADVYEALSSQRPYREKMSPEQALQMVMDGSGSHFDPQVVDGLVEVIQKNDDRQGEIPAAKALATLTAVHKEKLSLKG